MITMQDVTAKQLRDAKRFLSAGGIPKDNKSDIEIVHLAINNGFTGIEGAVAPPTPQPAAPTPQPAATPQLDLIGQAINTAIDAALAKHDIKIDDKTIIELINKHATKTLKVQHHNGSVKTKTTTIKGAHYSLETVVKLMDNYIRPYLVGGAGTGKTTLAKQACEALDLPFHMTGAVLQKFELLGFIDAGGQYHGTSFRDAYDVDSPTAGGFLFDEQDASAEDALVAFNAALDNGFCVFPDKVVYMSPKFRPIAAANTVGTGATLAFTGRNAQDAAVLNRYFMLEINIDEKIETAMAQAAWESAGGAADSNVWRDWLATLRNARRVCAQKGLQVQITPRDAEFGAKSLALGLDMKQTVFGTFGSSLTDSHLRELGLNH